MQDLESGTTSFARILIVEDDEVQQDVMKQILKMSGFTVDVAPSGEVGKEIIDKNPPDLVILDLHLPAPEGVTGLMLLKDIKENPMTTEIPVIMVSSDESEETYILCLSSGASEFLVKPLRMAELSLRIQNALELSLYKRQVKLANEKLEKEKKRLLRYFSEDLVKAILNEEISAELGGSSIDATILFMDIRNSTGIAEVQGPKKFAEFISLIFTDVMDLIFANKGSVNKLMGDGILATFGAPVPAPNDAVNAVKTALQIREYFSVINEMKTHVQEAEGGVGFGIGIATGKTFAGNIGSFRRMEYAVMGDAVNMAARLQDLSKQLKTDIVIDGNTRAKLDETFKLKQSEIRTIRGRQGELEIYVLD